MFLGKFEWCYGDSKECDVYNVNLLFIMECMDGVDGLKSGMWVV